MRWLLLACFVSCASSREAAQVPAATASSPPAPTAECPEDTAPTPAPAVVLDTAPALASARFESRTIGDEDRGPRWRGRRIDLDLKDADIGNVCRFLADVGHVNIVLGDGVQGQVTMTMRHVPWDQAFDAIVQAKGLRAERDGNVILVFARR